MKYYAKKTPIAVPDGFLRKSRSIARLIIDVISS
jgi:hypothetical protein